MATGDIWGHLGLLASDKIMSWDAGLDEDAPRATVHERRRGLASREYPWEIWPVHIAARGYLGEPLHTFIR